MYEATLVEEMLKHNGIDPNAENINHLSVFLNALRIYDERTKAYGTLWKKAGAIEAYFNAYRKIKRVWSVIRNPHLSSPEELEDDAYDAMNYLIFGVRCVHAGVIEEEDD